VPFVRLADVDEDKSPPLVPHLLLELLGGNLRAQVGRLRPDAAEGFVVDQLTDRWLRPTDGTRRILPELELAEAQLQRIEEHQPPEEGGACPDDPLDRLQCLDAPD